MGTEVNAKPKLSVLSEEDVKKLFLPGEVGAILEYSVFDPKIIDPKTGKPVVNLHRIMKSESFVRGFLELLWVQFAMKSWINPYSMKDTGNVARTIMFHGKNFDATAGAGVVTYGIVVGTGVTAPNIGDFALQTPIAHGAGVGQLQYGAVTFGAPASDATTSQFTITRNFANASGGSITVNEIGLYLSVYDSAGTQRFIMTIHDVIGGGIPVPNGQTLTVNYRPQCVI